MNQVAVTKTYFISSSGHCLNSETLTQEILWGSGLLYGHALFCQPKKEVRH